MDVAKRGHAAGGGRVGRRDPCTDVGNGSCRLRFGRPIPGRDLVESGRIWYLALGRVGVGAILRLPGDGLYPPGWWTRHRRGRARCGRAVRLEREQWRPDDVWHET